VKEEIEYVTVGYTERCHVSHYGEKDTLLCRMFLGSARSSFKKTWAEGKIEHRKWKQIQLWEGRCSRFEQRKDTERLS
jgi:hypothetical protein